MLRHNRAMREYWTESRAKADIRGRRGLRMRGLGAAVLLAVMGGAAPTMAAQNPTTTPPTPPEHALVSVKVGIEMGVLERAAQDTAHATQELARSIRAIAESPSLSQDQKAEIMRVTEQVEHLSDRVVHAMERLPDAVRASRDPLVATAEDLASELRWTVLALVALVLVLLLGGLWGIYAFVLRPARQTLLGISDGFHGMARSLEQSAALTAQVAQAQLELARALRSQPEQTTPTTASGGQTPDPRG